MSARGAADFLTRATGILAAIFVMMSIALAAVATVQRAPQTIDTSLARTPPTSSAPAAPAPPPAPVSNSAVPLAQ
jgi:preprotein translocase subunit SecG